MKATVRRFLHTRLLGVLLIVVLLGVWEVAARRLVQSPAFPPVTEVAEAWVRLLGSGELLRIFGTTLRRMLTGFALATVAGAVLGLLIGRFRVMYALLEPITELVRPIPSPAYVPLVILFLGIDDAMKVFVVFFGSLFPIMVNTYTGVRSVDPVLIDTGRTFGLTPLQTTVEIVVPASLPHVFAGMRISLGIALILVIIAEMVSGTDGAGHFIVSTQQSFRVPSTYAGVATLGVLGYTLNRALLLIEAKTIGWHVGNRGTTTA